MNDGLDIPELHGDHDPKPILDEVNCYLVGPIAKSSEETRADIYESLANIFLKIEYRLIEFSKYFERFKEMLLRWVYAYMVMDGESRMLFKKAFLLKQAAFGQILAVLHQDLLKIAGSNVLASCLLRMNLHAFSNDVTVFAICERFFCGRNTVDVDRMIAGLRGLKFPPVSFDSLSLEEQNLGLSIRNAVLGTLDKFGVEATLNKCEDVKIKSCWQVDYQVVSELIRNAIKAFPDEGGCVDVCLDVVGEYAIVTVADNGAGITVDDLPKIFNKGFSRRKGKQGGEGLGLSLIKFYMEEILKGRIEVESEVGRGTVFRLFFPTGAVDGN